LDVWKWAVLTASWLFKFNIEKYIDSAFSLAKIEELVPELSARNSFAGSEALCKMLVKCLRPTPK
jgi:hypothetical protein